MKSFTACLLLGLICFIAGMSHASVPSVVQLKARTFTPKLGTTALDAATRGELEIHHFFVQLDGYPDSSVRAELEEAGVSLLAYIPLNTWIASFESQALENADVRSRFIWVGEILPTDKMPTRWETGEYRLWAFQPDGRLEMRVRFHEDVDREAAATRLEAAGAELIGKRSIIGGFPMPPA
jgi:hypothetical protein